MKYFKLLLLSVLMSAGFSQAKAATLTFSQIDCVKWDYASAHNVTESGVTWSARNYFRYGHCSQSLFVGDDGWSDTQVITGSGFSVQSLEWSAARTIVMDATLPFMTIQGFNSGAGLVATAVISVGDIKAASSGTLFLSPLFTGLDMFRMTMNQSYDAKSPACFEVNEYGHQCGSAIIDNIVVNEVPLPAGFGLLFGALGLLYGFGRRKIQT